MDIFVEFVAGIGRFLFRIIIFEMILYFIGMIILTPLYFFDVKKLHRKHSHDFISLTGTLATAVIILTIAVIV